MSSTGFAPDATGGAYSTPADPIAGEEEAGRPLPKNPASGFRPTSLAVSSAKHPRKINPS